MYKLINFFVLLICGLWAGDIGDTVTQTKRTVGQSRTVRAELLPRAKEILL